MVLLFFTHSLSCSLEFWPPGCKKSQCTSYLLCYLGLPQYLFLFTGSPTRSKPLFIFCPWYLTLNSFYIGIFFYFYSSLYYSAFLSLLLCLEILISQTCEHLPTSLFCAVLFSVFILSIKCLYVRQMSSPATAGHIYPGV